MISLFQVFGRTQSSYEGGRVVFRHHAGCNGKFHVTGMSRTIKVDGYLQILTRYSEIIPCDESCNGQKNGECFIYNDSSPQNSRQTA
ncbi:MAG: hypothetical protein AAB877_02035 [Patescibacteria group bacterium]